MRPEDVARRYQFREGMKLVDFGEVGLPVFRLTLEAVTMAHRSMPTIQEFVMRCLAVGETSEAAIARMLGLKIDVVAGAINALVSDGYVARSPNVGSEAAFRLTDAGDLRLAHEREEVPQEEMLVIDYDATNRRYYQPINLNSASALVEGGLEPSESDPRFHQQMVYAVAMHAAPIDGRERRASLRVE